MVKGFRKKEVERLAERDFAAGSNVVSDGLSCWSAVEKAGCQHFPMATGSGKRAASWAPFKWINTWASPAFVDTVTRQKPLIGTLLPSARV
jgi:hypothetical protein